MAQLARSAEIAVLACLLMLGPTALSASSLAHAAQNEAWTPRVISTASVGASPTSIAVSPTTHMVYIVAANGTLDELNGTSGALVASLGLPGGRYVAIDPVTNTVYVAAEASGSVSNSTYRPDELYVLDQGEMKVSATVPVGSEPYGVAVDTATDMVYVADQNSDTVSIINGSTDALMATVTVGANPSSVAVDSTTGLVYVVTLPSDIYTINASTNEVIGSTSLNAQPFTVAVDPSTNTLYATFFFTQSVGVLDAQGEMISPTVNLTSSTDYPGGIAIDAGAGLVYVGDLNSGTVAVINATTNALQGYVTVGAYPEGVAVDPSTGYVYVANAQSGTVSVISSGPGPTSTGLSCGASLLIQGNSTTCTATVEGASPSGSVSWSQTGPGAVSFSPSSCTLVAGQCQTTVTGAGRGATTLIASYQGDSVNPPSSGTFELTVSNPSVTAGDVVQHEVIFPSSEQSNLTLRVTEGDVLVIGTIFGSGYSGEIHDTLSSAWETAQGPTPATSSQDDPDLGTQVWWAGVASTGEDTITVTGNESSPVVVDAFELTNANLSVIGESGGGGTGAGPTIENYDCSSCDFSPGSFVLALAAANPGGGNETCSPGAAMTDLPAQSPGFVIEPYCGGAIGPGGELVYGEYAAIDTPGYVVSLGVDPAPSGSHIEQQFMIGLEIPGTTSSAASGSASVTASTTSSSSTATSNQSATHAATSVTTSTTTNSSSSATTDHGSTSASTTELGIAAGLVVAATSYVVVGVTVRHHWAGKRARAG